MENGVKIWFDFPMFKCHRMHWALYENVCVACAFHVFCIESQTLTACCTVLPTHEWEADNLLISILQVTHCRKYDGYYSKRMNASKGLSRLYWHTISCRCRTVLHCTEWWPTLNATVARSIKTTPHAIQSPTKFVNRNYERFLSVIRARTIRLRFLQLTDSYFIKWYSSFMITLEIRPSNASGHICSGDRID